MRVCAFGPYTRWKWTDGPYSVWREWGSVPLVPISDVSEQMDHTQSDKSEGLCLWALYQMEVNRWTILSLTRVKVCAFGPYTRWKWTDGPYSVWQEWGSVPLVPIPDGSEQMDHTQSHKSEGLYLWSLYQMEVNSANKPWVTNAIDDSLVRVLVNNRSLVNLIHKVCWRTSIIHQCSCNLTESLSTWKITKHHWYRCKQEEDWLISEYINKC